MGTFKTLQEIYQEDGFVTAISEIKNNLLRREGAKYTKSVIGKRYHQKLYMYDQLGYWPDIQNPTTFNEKIAHRKLYTDKEIFSVVEDKWNVRKYVKDRINEGILPEVYHVTTDPETIPFDELPAEYVIKPTHMSGPVMFVEEGDTPDKDNIKQSCCEWLNSTYGETKEEYWYQRIQPRIIVEERLYDKEHGVPPDYKFYVFDGEVKYVHTDLNRFSGRSMRFYTRDWEALSVRKSGNQLAPTVDKPEAYSKMIKIAEQLGQEFSFIRVDLYNLGDRIVFGEMTVAPASGAGKFVPQEYDYKFGSLWEIS